MRMQPATNISFIIKKIAPLFKFAVVGSTGLVIDFGITWLLRDVLLINEYVASACGFAVAATNNYYINSKWTFKENATSPLQQFISFFIISLIGLGLKLILLNVFQGLHISFYASKFLAVVFIFGFNFTANKFITFSKGKVSSNNTLTDNYKPFIASKK
jgi:putative flippase GtrA